MIVVENRDFPALTTELHFCAGSAIEPKGKEGVTYMTGQLLTCGTQRLKRAEFTQRVETLGSSLDVMVGREFISVEGDSLSANRDEFFDLMHQALTEPAFDQVELDKLKRLTEAELKERCDNDEALAQHLFYQALYQPNAYARPVKGTVASINSITREDIVDTYERCFTPNHMRVGGCGDIDTAELKQRIDHLSSALPTSPAAPSFELKASDPGTIRVILVDKPERTQTQIFLGHMCISVHHPDFFPLALGNTIFGGTFTARLSHEIREKRGWSYGAYSYLIGRRHHGAFVYRFYPAMKDAVAALELGLKLHHDLVENGVSVDELDAVKSFLVNQFPFRLQTPRKQLHEKLRIQLLGLPEDYLETYVPRIQAITVADSNRALRTHLKPHDLTVVMVCTADKLVEQIRALPGVGQVEIYPYDKEWEHP
jgi:zinc protease